MISRHWEFKKIEEIADTYAGGTPPRTNDSMFGGLIPWVKSSELNFPEINDTEEKLTELGYSYSSTKWVPANTPLIAMYGATAGVVSWLKIRALTNQAVLAVVAKSQETDTRWLYWILKLYSNQLVASVQGSGQPNLSKGLIDELKISYPPLLEQQKAAKVLDKIDQAIAHTEALIAKYQRIKTGLMQDLLTRGIDEHGQLRDPKTHKFRRSPLGCIPEEWDVLPLERALSDIDAGKSPSCPDDPASGDEWGILKVSAIAPRGFQSQENKKVENPSYINPAYEVKDGDLLITRSNTYDLVGLVCLVKNPPPRLMLCDKTLRLKPNQAITNREFLFLALSTPASRKQIQIYATGTSAGMKNISQGLIKKILVAFPPSLREQKEICKILEQISIYDSKLVSKLDKLQKIKTGLMQDLLTGKISVEPLLSS